MLVNVFAALFDWSEIALSVIRDCHRVVIAGVAVCLAFMLLEKLTER